MEAGLVFFFFFSFFNSVDVNFQGDDIPSHADPFTLRKNGKQRVNNSQNILRASLELKENFTKYQMFIEALAPLFLWINQLVKFTFCLLFWS